jgi:DsbC/DsbD-like thiol-disulfide interchange protein
MTLVGLQLYLDSAPDHVIPKPLVPGALDDAPAQVVTATARLADEKANAITPGTEFNAVVTLSIVNGWHVYANPTGVPELKPTTLSLVPEAADRTVTLVKVSYPIGDSKILGSLGVEHVALYERKVEFTARLKVAADAKPGVTPIKFLLTYQSCNDHLCLPPAKMEVSLNATIGQMK